MTPEDLTTQDDSQGPTDDARKTVDDAQATDATTGAPTMDKVSPIRENLLSDEATPPRKRVKQRHDSPWATVDRHTKEVRMTERAKRAARRAAMKGESGIKAADPRGMDDDQLNHNPALAGSNKQLEVHPQDQEDEKNPKKKT